MWIHTEHKLRKGNRGIEIVDILCHRKQSNCVLNVLPRFHVADSVDCILLGLKPCWNEVTITHPFTIVNTGGERE